MMAHYAFLDENNIVTEVIVGAEPSELIEGLVPEDWYSNFRGQKCVQTSYTGSIRKNYASVGHRYDEDLDAFIAPKPFESWSLDENCVWAPPVPQPEVGFYDWDETTQSWVELELGENLGNS